MARILIAGCGYVGSALGALLVAKSDTVWGLRRRPAELPPGIRRLEADLSVPTSLRDLPIDLDYVVYAVSPGGYDDAHYRSAYVDGPRHLFEAFEHQRLRPRRVFFVSSTAVYGQSGGSWVDEMSPAQPESFAGRRVLEGECVAREGPCPVTVLRLGGIYGPRRTQLIDRVRAGSALYAADPPRYTNRIHRDDCAGVLAHLLSLESPAPLYLGVDSDPAPEREVYRWLAERLGVPAPPEDMDAGPGASKRCSNARLLASGYRLHYPSFRDGYAELLPGGTR
jgi:nucleoside-diphosphate-sugar epimerase